LKPVEWVEGLWAAGSCFIATPWSRNAGGVGGSHRAAGVDRDGGRDEMIGADEVKTIFTAYAALRNPVSNFCRICGFPPMTMGSYVAKTRRSQQRADLPWHG